MRLPDRLGPTAAALLSLVALTPAPVVAQSLTSGALKGVVRGTDGRPIRGVNLVLEGRGGTTISTLESGLDGDFRVTLLLPGEYRMLAELGGYQPVRVVGIVISAGETTVIVIPLERKPPPINEVQEIQAVGVRVGTVGGRVVTGRELGVLDWHREATDGLRGASEVVWAADGRAGFGLAALGLPVARSRVLVDGVVEAPVRHLGFPGEPTPLMAHTRDGLAQVRLIGTPVDAEWRGTLGTLFAAQTPVGAERIVFAPFVNASSAALGGRAADNPLDTTATSLQVGAVLSGPIVRDTASFFLRFDYRSLRLPTAYPWEGDSSRYQEATVSIRETALAIAQDSFATALGRHVGPALRTWRGASGMGKVDWLLSPTNRLGARVSFADWNEGTPYLGDGLALGAGAALDARDISAALGITSGGATVSNELRAGFSTSRRRFTSSGLPETSLVGEGVAFGGGTGVPASFDLRTIDVSDAVQYGTGDHQIKGGISLTSTSYQYDYRYGSEGVFRFADLDRFGAGRGSFYQARGTEVARFSTFDLGLFIQDTWLAAPDLQLVAGLRYDLSPLPKNKIGFNSEWFNATGVRNDSARTTYSSIGPRIGFVWDVRGEWVVRGGLGLYYGRVDPASFAEAILYDGGVTVRRAVDTFSSWPALPDETIAPVIGPALTILNGKYRAPRAFKAEMGLSRAMAGGVSLHLQGSYHHTDFLLRRTDLNRVVDPLGTTQEGRPVFGRLRQEGGLVAGVIGSNHRFADFDVVSGLSPVGFSDHYEVTAALVREVPEGISLTTSYTYSKTIDNLVGLRSLDPNDQLSPFVNGTVNGVLWDRSRSDFDVPHRAAATVSYRSAGRNPVSLAARYRVRSGLPFTPGFRPGVDVNGDGAGNDPVYLGGALPGLAEALAAAGCPLTLGNQFAGRNSCREKLQQGLDLNLSIGLPFGPAGRRVMVEVDAFNVVATETGVVDRAAALVDPAGTLLTDGSGNVTLPLIANPRLGALLARRGEPRMVRVGLRMEY